MKAEAVDVERMERQLRDQVEEAVGRRLSDDEWEAFKQLQLERMRAGAGPGATEKRASGFWASLVGLAGFVALPLLVGLLVAAVVGGLLLGLLWVYAPGTLDDGGGNGDVVGGLIGLWFVGALIWATVSDWSVATWVLIGLGLFAGVVALAIGALLRVAGG